MSIVLACAARLETEFERFQKLYPQLAELYAHIHLACRSTTAPEYIEAYRAFPKVSVTIAAPNYTNWRFLTIQKALEFPCKTIHYADFDHILRWALNHPAELRESLEHIQQADCTLIGRKPASMARYAKALTETEAIINRVFSYVLGHKTDTGSGTRGLSRQAVEHLMQHSHPDNDFYGTDAEWPVLLHKAGFRVKTIWVDGLSWLLPSHVGDGQDEPSEQQRAAYDQDPTVWAYRVKVAQRIIEAGLSALDK